MKKFISILVAMLAVSVFTVAQLKLYVYEKDGSVSQYIAANVDSIVFSEQDADIEYEEVPNLPVTDRGYVDMGLSVKWATCNLGAWWPEDYGNYYAWGETEPKTNYTLNTYKWCEGDFRSFTKYCAEAEFGTVDNLSKLEAEDDAASVNLGGNWRMPTIAEFEELFNEENCAWVWTDIQGVYGYLITSKINGNSIFLPAAGCIDGRIFYGKGTSGAYWASDSVENQTISTVSYGYDFVDNSIQWFSSIRNVGHTIRPVMP